MTVYSPYYDSYDHTWYVDVMTPTGTKKQRILNPLYYFHLMKVNPPVGSKFEEEIVEDYEDLLADYDIEYDLDALEPYENLSDPIDYYKSTVNALPTTQVPAVSMSINTQSDVASTSISSNSIIPLTTSFVSVNTLNPSQDNEEIKEMATIEKQENYNASVAALLADKEFIAMSMKFYNKYFPPQTPTENGSNFVF